MAWRRGGGGLGGGGAGINFLRNCNFHRFPKIREQLLKIPQVASVELLRLPFVKVSNLKKVWGQYVIMLADIYYRKHERVMFRLG